MRATKGSVADPLEGYRLTAPHSTDANVAQLRRGCRQSLRAYRLTQRGGFAGTNLNVRGPRASCVNVRVTRPTPETLSYGVSRRADPGGPSLARFVDTRDSRFETRRLVLSRPRTAGASLRELGRRRHAHVMSMFSCRLSSPTLFTRIEVARIFPRPTCLTVSLPGTNVV